MWQGEGEEVNEEDPALAMRIYWDSTALELSSGVVDLLEVVPEPLVLSQEILFFTPFWATTLPFQGVFTGADV